MFNSLHSWFAFFWQCTNFLSYLFIITLGVVGDSYTGDIAIDDVIFSPDCLIEGSRGFPNIPATCAPDEFTCKQSTNCLPKSLHCDGIKDCKDGSDEAGKCRNRESHHGSNVAGGIVGTLVCIAIVIVLVVLFIRRRRDKENTLFSVFYNSSNRSEPESEPDHNASSGYGLSLYYFLIFFILRSNFKVRIYAMNATSHMSKRAASHVHW